MAGVFGWVYTPATPNVTAGCPLRLWLSLSLWQARGPSSQPVAVQVLLHLPQTQSFPPAPFHPQSVSSRPRFSYSSLWTKSWCPIGSWVATRQWLLSVTSGCTLRELAPLPPQPPCVLPGGCQRHDAENKRNLHQELRASHSHTGYTWSLAIY